MNPPDPLDDLLAVWQVEAEVPVEFRRQVWHRIAADQEALPWSARLLSWWFQPRRLLASVAAAVLFGGLLGFVEANVHQKEAKAAYFSAINPLDSQHHHILAAR